MNACVSLIFLIVVNLILGVSSENDKGSCTCKDADTSNDSNRPCSLEDLDCIRSIFSKRMGCKAVQEKQSGIFPLNMLLHAAHSNASLQFDCEAKGFDNYQVKEFAIDNETNTMVFEVELKKTSLYSKRSCAYFYRKGQEPYRACDYCGVTYKNLLVTMTVYDRNETSNDQSSGDFNIHVFVYLTESNPFKIIGPGIIPTEPDVFQSFKETVEEFDLTLQEFFITKGKRFMEYFLKTAICDIELEQKC